MFENRNFHFDIHYVDGQRSTSFVLEYEAHTLMKPIYGKAVLIGALLGVASAAFSQTTGDTTTISPAPVRQSKLNFRMNASVTNNGFSFIPAFSLGKPAAIFNFNVNNGKRFSFEPEFRFSLLDAKPWSFIFIWRYRLINTSAFQLTAGAHLPAVPFRTIEYVRNGVKYETLANYRFLPFELSPNWNIGKNVSIGMFYLYSYGFGDATRHTNFVSLRANFSNIPLSRSLYLRFNPQVLYLKLDKQDGYYFASNLTLAQRNFPFSISSIINKPLKTTTAGKNLDWNVSLVYTLDKQFVRQ